MYKHIKLYVLIFLLLSFFNGISQEQQLEEDYLEKENQRLEKAQQIENDIKKYINQNLSKYKLTEERINEIKNSPSCYNNGSLQFGKKIKKQEEVLKNVLLEKKNAELIKLYFQNNPENERSFKSTPLNTKAISCVNGGFENGVPGYTFRHVNNSTTWSNLRNNIGVMPNNFVNAQFNNNNTAVSLVSPSNVFVGTTNLGFNSVRTGNRAIKLNGTHTDNNDFDITTLERNLIIDDNFLDVNFSLIMDNPGHNWEGCEQVQSCYDNFFRICVYDVNNNLVDCVMIESNPNNCIFQSITLNGRQILYTNWVCARLNVGQIINQQGRLEIMIADCGGGAHFSTVYIDDICGSESNCTNPIQGSINLNPLDSGSCPNLPLEVCGTYILPPNSSLGSLQLDILDFNNQNIVYNTITSPSTVTTNTFCFQVNSNNLASLSGQYEFRVRANFIVNCPVNPYNWNVSDTSTNLGPDIDFNAQQSIQNIQINHPNVSWDNNAPTYVLEFISDGKCCGVNSTIVLLPIYHTYVSNTPNFDANSIFTQLNSNCFRWRAKPNNSCGEWSDWCCITKQINNECYNFNIPHISGNLFMNVNGNNILIGNFDFSSNVNSHLNQIKTFLQNYFNYPVIISNYYNGNIVLSFIYNPLPIITNMSNINGTFLPILTGECRSSIQDNWPGHTGLINIPITNPFLPSCHPNPPCELDYQVHISNTLNNVTQDFNADGIITANNIIENNSNVKYLAGLTILLQPNFYVQNSNFLARIEECSTEIEPLSNVKKTNNKTRDNRNVKDIGLELVKKDVIVYPNPNNGIFEVQLSQETTGTLEIYDLLGKVIFNKNIDKEQYISVDLQNYLNGIYILRLNTNNESISNKIIKN